MPLPSRQSFRQSTEIPPTERYLSHSCVGPTPPTVKSHTSHFLSQINPVYALPDHLFKTHLIASSHICLGLPQWSLPSSFIHKNLACIYFQPIRAARAAHLTFRDFIPRIIFGKEYKSRSSKREIHTKFRWENQKETDDSFLQDNLLSYCCVTLVTSHINRLKPSGNFTYGQV
jgi:hypothetical protein